MLVIALALPFATVLTVVGTIYVVDNLVAPIDIHDPLARQGGPKP
jgi:hypothetical protein